MNTNFHDRSVLHQVIDWWTLPKAIIAVAIAQAIILVILWHL